MLAMKLSEATSASLQKMTLLLNRKNMKYSNRRATRKVTSFMLIAQTAIGRSNLAGRNPTEMGEYFQWNVLTSFQGKSGQSPDIWIPGRKRVGSKSEVASREQPFIPTFGRDEAQYLTLLE
jgi:hypothetical protein